MSEHDAWAEGFEAGSTWHQSGPAGIPNDPPANPYPDTDFVDIVFDGPPDHEAGRFVECEDAAGRGIRFGEWIDRGNGQWVLRVARTQVSPTTEISPHTYMSLVGSLATLLSRVQIPNQPLHRSVAQGQHTLDVDALAEALEIAASRIADDRHYAHTVLTERNHLKQQRDTIRAFLGVD
ncbi:hypothetical protein SEA_MORGANA_66 [Gordonia phage Morgana]|uniref:Minor tail protein n=1 Tax=Gordonia phage Morgana TaxID=3137292 RepID=A0AAX4RCV3_9CAUD